MFVSPLDLRAYRPDEWVVLAPLRWDSSSLTVVVARGFVTDLASIPRPLRGVLSVTGRSRRAAVLHDYCYCMQAMSRAQADELFRSALVADGMSAAVARAYWLGVRGGGWRYWNQRRRNPLTRSYDFVSEAYWSGAAEAGVEPALTTIAPAHAPADYSDASRC